MEILNRKQGASKLLVAAIVLILALTACGGNQSGGGIATGTDNAGNQPQTAAQDQEGAQEMAASGSKLVVYTAGPGGVAEAIKEGFEAKTGITIEQFDGTTGKILARLEAEKNNPVADVVILASWPSGIAMKEQGLTQSYAGAANSDNLYPTWIDADKHLFGYSASALGMTYNTKLVDNPPSDWADFAGADWQGAVNIPDPSLSGSALDFISGYLNERGDEGWELFQALKNNGVALAGANKEALDPVITGAKSAVMAGVDYMAYSEIAKGEPIEIAYPISGTVINPRPSMILKDAQNVENAQKFIDYLLSDEAQEMVANAYLLPGRSDVPAHQDRTQVDEIKLLDYDWNWMTEQGPAITTEFLDLFK
ncbi:ABC transporter substrate-binding protein [Xylanibacillus composti]|uniref:ABC transporter substrate-binding protein n=1 Tax=Xylanibacillus composti TaxID=1572762 RepID=A0A8J4H546_9BACL|nr:ABC transporter substrate-binding protein [Xylanibacillus composti]GIQ69676.1 ABC transporter substrate-binding protein [Xylanibacillus composti]